MKTIVRFVLILVIGGFRILRSLQDRHSPCAVAGRSAMLPYLPEDTCHCRKHIFNGACVHDMVDQYGQIGIKGLEPAV